MAGELVVESRGLSKSYGSLIALDAVTFEVRRGEIFGFIGADGLVANRSSITDIGRGRAHADRQGATTVVYGFAVERILRNAHDRRQRAGRCFCPSELVR